MWSKHKKNKKECSIVSPHWRDHCLMFRQSLRPLRTAQLITANSFGRWYFLLLFFVFLASFFLFVWLRVIIAMRESKPSLELQGSNSGERELCRRKGEHVHRRRRRRHQISERERERTGKDEHRRRATATTKHTQNRAQFGYYWDQHWWYSLAWLESADQRRRRQGYKEKKKILVRERKKGGEEEEEQ